MTVHGFPDDLWAPANEEAKGGLMPVAHARQIITHSEAVPQIRSISFLATDRRFFFLLREISAGEYRGGRGIFEAVVVRKWAFTGHCPFFSILRGVWGSTCRTRTIYGLSRSARFMANGMHSNYRSRRPRVELASRHRSSYAVQWVRDSCCSPAGH